MELGGASSVQTIGTGAPAGHTEPRSCKRIAPMLKDTHYMLDEAFRHLKSLDDTRARLAGRAGPTLRCKAPGRSVVPLTTANRPIHKTVQKN